MKNDLVERYLYAVTRKLPKKMREDVNRELESLISDMLEERCGEVVPTDKDIRVVLTELGTPSELAEKYDPDQMKCLIGAPYYTTYKLVLRIVLTCTVFGMAVAGFINILTGDNPIWYVLLWQWLGMIISGAFSAFGFVTLLFAFFERKQIKLDTVTGLDDLPPVPKKQEMISKAECIFGILFSVFFMTVFLCTPQIFCAILPDQQLVIPIFQAEVVRKTWYLIFILSMIGIIGEIVKLIEGRYNIRVMVTTIVADLLSMIVSTIWLLQRSLFNEDFMNLMGDIFYGKGTQFMEQVFRKFNLFFLGIMLFALLLDMVTVVVRTLKQEKN